jgi:group II intron reverse transcriptase/maturase
MAAQADLFLGAAECPQGAVGGAAAGRPVPAPRAVRKPKIAKGQDLPAMVMEEVAKHDNLRYAFQKVASNQGAPGPDRQTIAEVRERFDVILRSLHQALLDGSYRPGDVRRVWIPKAGGGQRGLGIPNVVDRIVQQAVHQVLSPQYEPTFHASSHGFRPDRGSHTAIAEARTHVEAGFGWVVDIDLEKFFDTVNHDRLMSRLGERIRDKRLLRLIGQMLRAKVVLPDGVVTSTAEGTPQGGPLSPLLSNIVLDELDSELSRRGHRFVRYADDCNIYVQSERAGKRVMESLVRFIERRLRLKVNQAKSAVAQPDQRHFLGFSLRRDPLAGTVAVLPSARTKTRMAAQVVALTPRTWGGPLSACVAGINRYFGGWVGYFGVCDDVPDTRRWLHGTDAHVRRRLRALKLKQCKRKRGVVRYLVAMGAKRQTAQQTVYGRCRSTWVLSHKGVVERAMSNAWFTQKGLTPLEHRWQVQQLRIQDALVPRQYSLLLG